MGIIILIIIPTYDIIEQIKIVKSGDFMKKNTIITIICIIIILVCVVGYFAVRYFLDKDLEEQKQELNQTIETYGTVEKETVDVLVAKFNTQVMDNNSSSLNPASTDYLTESNNEYWYGLIEGVYLVVVPEKYTGDKTTETVNYTLLYVDKTSKYESDAISYIKYLIKANNSEITDSEIDTLLEDAKTKINSGKTANNGKGISIGYTEKDEAYQYQVLRLYK